MEKSRVLEEVRYTFKGIRHYHILSVLVTTTEAEEPPEIAQLPSDGRLCLYTIVKQFCPVGRAGTRSRQ